MCGKANCVAFIAVCILFRAYGLFVRYRARAYDNMYLIYKYLVQGNLRCLCRIWIFSWYYSWSACVDWHCHL